MRLGALWIGNEFSTTAAGPTLPGAPTNVVATAGNAQASVAFTQAINNGGSPIQYYTVQSNPGPITATGTVSPIIVPGLTNGTGYIFEADETNLVGTGPWSLYSSSVTPMAPVTSTVAVSNGIYSPLNFIIDAGSAASGKANATYMPATDFFNNARTTNDIGATVFASPGTYTAVDITKQVLDPIGGVQYIGSGLTVTQSGGASNATISAANMASFSLFQSALTAAINAGHNTITCTPGSYTWSSPNYGTQISATGTVTNWIRIIGTGVTLTGTSKGSSSSPQSGTYFFQTGSTNHYLSFENFTLTNGGYAVTVYGGDHLRFNNFTITQCGNSGFNGGNYNGGPASYIEVSNCTLTNCVQNWTNGSPVSWPGALQIGAQYVTIAFNTVSYSGGEGIGPQGLNFWIVGNTIFNTSAPSLYDYGNSYQLYEGNFVYQDKTNQASWFAGTASGGQEPFRLADEHTDNLIGYTYTAGISITVRNNIFWGNGSTPVMTPYFYTSSYTGAPLLHARFENNTIVSTSGGSMLKMQTTTVGAHSDVIIANNICASLSGTATNTSLPTGVTCEYDNWYNTTAGSFAGTGDVTGNPYLNFAYYVATTGTTGNDGLSTTYPVTLAQAQTLMRASSWIKTAYLAGGTYAMSAPLSLTSADNGESWLAYPGQVPVLDGGSATTKAFDVESANNVTIRWLTIQNFTQSGIYFQSTTGTFIDSNTVQDITTPAGLGNNAGIFGGLGNHNLTITHNLVQGVNSNGITCLDSNSTSGTYMSNVSISYNAVYNSMLTDSDGGAISTDNRPYLNTGVLINNNVIGNHGNAGNQTKGIYLDDLSSYTTITNNIVYGTGTDSFQIHGGNNNTIQNNIFDITLSSVLGFYQSTPSQPAGADMTNNVFTENIVYSSANPPSSLWTLSGISNPLVPPVDQTNLYWSTSGTQFVPGAGNGAADTNPTVANPGFVNAAANNYNFVSGPPAITGGSFTPISIASVGPLPNNG